VKRTKLQENNNILEQKIKEQTGWNKSRVFIIVGLVVSIIRLERVNLKKISKVLNPEKTKEVNYRRLNRFFQKFRFDKTTMAKLMSNFLPKGKLILSMDRTNWKFGKVNINILMLSVAYKGMAIPIVWYLLNKGSKQGNSNYRDRIRVMKKFIDVFGVDSIEVLVADREFVGEVWFRWLKKRNIPFVIRVMNNKHIKVNRGSVRIDSLFSNLKMNEYTYYQTRKEIYGYDELSIVALKMKDEYLILATNIKQEKALSFYKRRWEIEMLFSAFKKRGFNLEETHMTDNKKIDSLIAILSLAFAWSHNIGEWLNDEKPIKRLKHKRMAMSIFLYGLEYLSEILLNYEHREDSLTFVFSRFQLQEFEN
jgi:transposase